MLMLTVINEKVTIRLSYTAVIVSTPIKTSTKYYCCDRNEGDETKNWSQYALSYGSPSVIKSSA